MKNNSLAKKLDDLCIEDFKKLMLDIATKDLPNPKRITKQVH